MSLPFHGPTSPLTLGLDVTTSPNTASQALYGAKESVLTQRFDSILLTGTESAWAFVYGGSYGVSQFAIQLAKLSGYEVVTPASVRNREFMKSLGADPD